MVAVNLEQRGRSCVESTVTVGRLTDEPVAWTDLPELLAKPGPDAVDLSTVPAASVFRLSRTCEVRIDPANAGFLQGRTGDPLRLRLWVKPRRKTRSCSSAWSRATSPCRSRSTSAATAGRPTVQLTALLRGNPAPGWLRVEVNCRAVHGQWFDEDATVIDSSGRLICQARQLALTPLER